MTAPQTRGAPLLSGLVLLALAFAALLLGGRAERPVPEAFAPTQAEERAAGEYGRLPLTFTVNRGQVDRRVRFYARGDGYAFYFTRTKVALSFTDEGKGMALHLTPLGANPHARLEATDRAPGRVNYMVGSQRQASLPTYYEVIYRDLWPGIDLVFRGQGGSLKYEFRLTPGADPRKIALAYRGADSLALGAAGDLRIKTTRGTLRDSRPQSFQRVNGKRVPVASRYALRGGASGYGFRLGQYDTRRPLVIDPGLVYSTFLGTAGSEGAGGIAVDAAGNAYVTGTTSSSSFPVTPGAFQVTHGGGCCASDVFVAKLNAAGSALVYATYLGGGPTCCGYTGVDSGLAIAVDGAGSAYVTGQTLSGNYPTTTGAFREFNSGGDAFVTKLSPTGSSLVYSTFLGGSNFQGVADAESGRDIAVDGAGNAYVTGTTIAADFPTTSGAADTTRNGQDAFVTKLSPGGGALGYSTYLGGSSDDDGVGIAVHNDRAYVTGRTLSSDFPLAGTSYDGTLGGSQDAFVTKFNFSGSGHEYSTYLGGDAAWEEGEGIAVDAAGNAYVLGRTASSDFPTTPGGYDTTPNGGLDAFVTKLGQAGDSLAYSTLLGGSNNESGFGRAGIAVDSAGGAWVTGRTESLDFPTTPGALSTARQGNEDGYVTKVNETGAALGYSSYLGGVDNDDIVHDVALGGGNVYLTGETNSSNFPTTAGAYDTTFGGGGSPPNGDAFVTVLDDDQDGDGLLDSWESQGVTIDGQFVDLPAMGASPTHKDVFVEIDYMTGAGFHSHRPIPAAISKIITAFDNAPVSNPDGTNGVRLHVDYGSNAPLVWAPGNWGALSRSNNLAEQANLGTGAGTGASPYDWTAFDAIKDANFTEAREEVFRYNAWAHNLSMAMGTTSGISRGLPGSDFLVSLGGWTSDVGTTDEQAGTFMHELGHNLGLGHGGGDDVQWKPNLMSVMRYSFQTKGLIVDGKEGTFDYSRSALPALNENSLDETAGTGTGSTRGTRYFCGLDNEVIDVDGSSVDWNCDTDSTDTGVTANVNQGITDNSDSTFDTLSGHDDWANLVYDGGAVGGLGGGTLPQTTVANELTQEQNASLPDLTARYPRPKGATPLRVPLVPAFVPCSASNRTHGPPLAYPSCNPPQLESGQLTVGAPDANGHPVNALGFVRYGVQVGIPGGVDDSDVSFSMSLTDVREQGTLVDYTGELQAVAVARITDRINGPAAIEPSTVSDVSFPVTVPCTATGGSADVGATCAVTTSLDAVMPGAIPEGKRAVWGLEQIKVFDGGSDGDVDTTPNRLFAVQGVFVP